MLHMIRKMRESLRELKNLELFFITNTVFATASTIYDRLSTKTEDVIIPILQEMSEDKMKFEAKVNVVLPLLAELSSDIKDLKSELKKDDSKNLKEQEAILPLLSQLRKDVKVILKSREGEKSG